MVIEDGTAHLGPCGVQIAENAGAEDVVALDGRSVDEVRSLVEAAAG